MRIHLVDDHPEVLASLAGFLGGLGHQVLCDGDGRAALRRLNHEAVDLVISDVRMPGIDGLALLDGIEGLDHPPPVALMTAFADAQTAIEALRRGAVDYLRKPIEVQELFRLVERISADRAPVSALPPNQADGLVVAGQALARVVALADRFHAAKGLPCVIEAETGCGKELIARRIHHGGQPGCPLPFVALNCAAISPELFEAELFGFAPGAFTGARVGGSEGKLAFAGNGTLFLDEISELRPELQAKLLRVLEDRTWYPIGSNQLCQLRARVVCATNRPLADLVLAGTFREDLLYRLKVGHLRIPPLRERTDEVGPLAHALMREVRRSLGRGFTAMTPEAELMLTRHRWPGNVRELRNLLESLSVTTDGELLLAEHLAGAGLGRDPVASLELRIASRTAMATAGAGAASTITSGKLDLPPDGFDLDGWQRKIVAAAMALNGGSPVRAAHYLGVSRKVLYTLRKRYGLLAATDGDDDAGQAD